jgi:hypothetical protein
MSTLKAVPAIGTPRGFGNYFKLKVFFRQARLGGRPQLGGTSRIGETDAMSREVIFEFYRLGNSVKVSAVDTETLTEVSVVGPVTASEATLRNNALRKLEFVLARRGAQGKNPR